MRHAKKLPWLVAGLGFAGFILRMALYLTAMDGPWLLKTGTALETALWLLTAAAAVLIAVSAWKLGGSEDYEDNFDRSYWALVGHVFFGAGIFLTVLGREPEAGGFLGLAWKVLGYASAPCLIAAGAARLRGKKPAFFLHMVPCLFLMLHIINRYRTWNSAPQLQSYIFAMGGAMALMFFAYYLTAFDVELGKRRLQLLFGLSALYLCMVELAKTDCGWLYLGGALWAGLNLCSLEPVPKDWMEEEGYL